MKIAKQNASTEVQRNLLTDSDIETLTSKVNELQSRDDKTWEEYLKLINRRYVKSVVETLSLARACHDAYSNLDDRDWAKLEGSVSFGAAKLSIFRQIGSDERLYEKEVIIRLPAAYSTIYQIHLLDDEEFKQSLERGLIYPNVTRERIESVRLRRGYTKLAAREKACGGETTDTPDYQQATVRVTAPEQEFVLYGELKVPRGFANMAKLHEALLSIVETYGVEFVPVPGREARLAHERQNDLESYPTWKAAIAAALEA